MVIHTMMPWVHEDSQPGDASSLSTLFSPFMTGSEGAVGPSRTVASVDLPLIGYTVIQNEFTLTAHISRYGAPALSPQTASCMLHMTCLNNWWSVPSVLAPQHRDGPFARRLTRSFGYP
jgi:hypothetical protein